MTVLQSPEAMIVICTVILIAYTAHVLDKAFASSEQFEAMLKARERIMGLQAENAKLRELAVSYDSALRRICDQMQGYVDCHDCILGKDYGDDSCAIDELREAACVVKVELE